MIFFPLDIGAINNVVVNRLGVCVGENVAKADLSACAAMLPGQQFAFPGSRQERMALWQRRTQTISKNIQASQTTSYFRPDRKDSPLTSLATHQKGLGAAERIDALQEDAFPRLHLQAAA